MADLHDEYLSDSDDVLSFANLPIPGYMYDVSGRVSSSSDQDRFEFLNSFGPDPVKNDPFSQWGRTESKSRVEARPSFKIGSYRSGSRTGSVRKSFSRSVRVTGTNHLHASRFWPVQKKIGTGHSRHEPAQVSPTEEVPSGNEPEKSISRGFHFANVLAKFGCLSA